MFEGLLAKLALGTVWSKVKTNAVHDWQAIPPKARLWVIIGVAAIVLGFAHQWYAHRELKKARAEGYAQAVSDIRAAEAKKVAPLKAAKVEVDAKNVATNTQVRKTHDAQDTHISGNLADLLGVLDRAQGGVRGNAGGNLPGFAAGAGAQRTAASADDGLAQDAAAQGGAAGDVLIAVPGRQLYTRAAQCDRDYAALTAWEDGYQGWLDHYNEWLVKTRKITH